MKRNILSLVALAAFSLNASAQTEGKFLVDGTVKGLGDSINVIIVDPMTNRPVTRDKRAIKDDSFNLDFDLSRAAYLMVRGTKPGTASFTIPALPGEKATVNGDAMSYRISGTQFYKDYSDATDSYEAPQAELNKFIAECQAMMANGVSQDSVMKVYNAKGPALQTKVSEAALAYIKANPDNEASALLITTAGEDYEGNVKLLSEKVQNGRTNVFYKGILEQIKKQKEMEAKQNALEGKEAPDFTLNDINGKPLKLSSLRGKYVILDFWGSWCGWCIKGMPQMKEYYAKYKGKMEILGVDCNDTEEKWKAAVKKEQLPWLHVYNPRGNSADPCKLYAIQGFPTKIVIDPQGKVAKIVVGEDPSFYDYLDSLFK